MTSITPFIKLSLNSSLKIAKFNYKQKITFPNIQHFITKVIKLKDYPQQIDIVADFDHTLTQHQIQQTKCDTLFGMWVKHPSLNPKFKQDLINNYMKYGPFQTDSSITFQQRIRYVDILYQIQRNLFQKYKITTQDATKVLQDSQLVFRSHSRQLFSLLNQQQIKLHIISGGISDLIYNSIANIVNNQVADNICQIYSNKWQLNQSSNQQLLQFVGPTVHSFNKYKAMKENKKRKRNCILLGDLKSDIYMAHDVGYRHILSVFYGKKGEFDQRALAEDKFDVIVEGDSSHKIVVQLLKMIVGRKNIDWQYLYGVNEILPRLIL